MEKTIIELRDKWLNENAEIIKLLNKNGFYAKIKETTTNLLFFDKQIENPFSLGADINDEFVSLPEKNYARISDLYKKYHISIQNYTNFHNHRNIKRDRKISITYCIRINIEESERQNYSSASPMAILILNRNFEDSKILSTIFEDSKIKNPSYHYGEIKDYRGEITLENIRLVISDATEIIKKATKIINDNIPKVIEELRAEIFKYYEEYEQALLTMNLETFLEGAILQFDALHTKSTINKKNPNP